MSASRSLNKVMLIGNLTRDPVIKTTTNGSKVCTFGLATNSTWKNAEGEVQERTEFHNIVAWNKLAEICEQILSTGVKVYVEGELRTRVWDDENGQRHYRTEIKIDDMQVLDDKKRRAENEDSASKQEEVKPEEEKTEDKDTETEEEKPKEEKEPDVDEKELEKEAEDLF